MTTYLSSDELADLIGCKPNQRAAMVAWLLRNRWPFVVDRNGLPKVSRAYHDAKMNGLPAPTSGLTDGPNLQAFAPQARAAASCSTEKGKP